MLTLQNVAIARGTDTLIEHIDLAVFKKNIIGIVGANGCGKSSLFAAIRGDLEPSHGEIKISGQIRMVSLVQELPGLTMTALEYTLSGDQTLFGVLQNLKEAEQKDDYDAIMECHNTLSEIDGYSAESRAAKILKGLGFLQEVISQPVKQFSGGWRMRLNLAKCLFAPSDLLLLDEPTNHLDMEAIIWLEEFLRHYVGAILMVSHDQEFLDNTVTQIAHIENQRLKVYTGDYSAFEIQRAQQIALQNARYKKQQAQIAHMMKFVDKFRYKASKAQQAQSRLKAIERMEMVKPIYDQSPFQFHFLKPGRIPNPMLTMKQVDLGYNEKIVLKRVNFHLMADERIGLLGVNGAGKSTLIKGICGEIKPMGGIINRPASLKIGYFAQHQVDCLPLDASALSLLKDLSHNSSEKELTQYLGSFGFSRDQSLSLLKRFSGGEKSRVALALIIWQRPNLLLLDEPTNHLDLEMRQALMYALQEYQGAMILVSHDRHLLRTLVDGLYLINNQRVSRFEDGIEAYYQNAKTLFD